MTKFEYKREVRLGKWANIVSLADENNRVDWQYPEQQQTEFDRLWLSTPTFNQKFNAERLVLLKKFCADTGHRPRHDTSKRFPHIISAGEVSPEEDMLAIFVDTVRAGNISFQYPEQHWEFEEIYTQYPTWAELCRRQGF
jgi:hypothetical protein